MLGRLQGFALWGCMLSVCVQAYNFPTGFVHRYTHVSVSNVMDHRNVTTVLKFEVERLGEDASGRRSHTLRINSYVQFMPGTQVLENPGKWDLSKDFVFVSNPKGTIVLVHSHPEDRQELLTVKKALAGLFSVHVQEEQETDEWHYTAEEADHLGVLKHNYTAQRTAKGLTLSRQHASVGTAHRFHDKTLHYDHQGTLQTAVAHDHILVKDKTAGMSRTKSFPDEQPMKVSSSGEFPDFEASSYITVKYAGKRKTNQLDAKRQQELLAKLRADTLETHHERNQTDFKQVQQNITKAWDCIHKNPEKDSENRSACVNELREYLRDMKSQDYKNYVSKIFSKVCDDSNKVCEDDRLVLLDIVTRLGDNTSQELVVTYVLSKHPLVDEELRRVFIHCAALEHPTDSFVAAVEKVCFGEDGEHLGTRTLGRTQGRACLAVGSLVKHLSASGQRQQADRLASALESWLEQHGEGDAPITKRDTGEAGHAWMSEEEELQHLSKAVLLHSLGNGAQERSKPHLLRHVVPNSGHHIWRRAALDALRHYSCHESARAMFNSVMQDEVFSVRRMALGVFGNHPRRNDVTREEENDILSQNYTYTAVGRVKRNVLEKVLFQFQVALPSYEWSRELGNSKAGASFGVKFQNSIEGMFRVLSGYVDVDVHDKLWAEVHIGLISLQADVLLIEACYRGRLSYNMNLVKDFTVDLMKDINSAFEHVVNRVMEPLGNFSSHIASQYQNAATGQPKSGFQPLADAVKKLPEETKSALQATEEFNEEADLLGALPLVKKLQAVTKRAQSLMEDVHNEASELFTNIVDVAEVALPFAEKEIRSSVNSVLGVLNKVKDYPNQAFAVIERSKMRYQLAMTRILEGSKIIKQVFSFLSGGKSSWSNAGEEVKSIIKQTKSLIAKIKADFSRHKRQAASSNANYSQCAKVELDDTLIRLYNKSEGMVTQLEIILNHSPGKLQRALDLMHTQTEILKAGFASFKEAIDIIKSRIQALFGVKFHPSFPSQRRDCDSQCGCGTFPTDCNRYGHPGVDLVWANGWKVRSPVTGMVYKNGSNAVQIKTNTSDLKEYEIFVSNVEVHANYTNQTVFFVEAGQVFGYSLGENGCNKGHIHLAMRRTSNQTGVCHYVDPSPFLDTFQPVPTWRQECKEFTFKHIGQVIDFGNLTGGFKSLLTKLKRPALKWLQNQVITKVSDLIPDNSLLAPFKNLSLTFLRNINTNAGSLKNLFTPGWDAAKEFFKDLMKNKLSFKDLLSTIANSNLLKLKYLNLQQIIDAAQKLMKIPISFEQLKSRTVGAISRIWKGLKSANFSLPSFQLGNFFLPSFKFGNFLLPSLKLNFSGLRDLFGHAQSANGTGLKDFLSGAKEQLLTKLKTLLRKKLCPALGKFLAKQGSPCIPHDDCKGLLCDIEIRRKHVTGKVSVDVKVDPDNQTVTINVDGQKHTVAGDDDKFIPTGLKLFNAFDVQFRMNATWKNGTLQFSLTLQACGPNLCCLPDVVLARNLSFSNFSFSDLRNALNSTDVDFELLPLDSSYKVLTDLNVDSPELTSSILGIKDLVQDSLGVELPPDTQYRVEFKDPEEHADDGQFPMTGQNTEIYFPFIGPVRIPITFGIVTLWIEFSGGGAVGLAFSVHVQAVDSHMKATVTPWASAKIKAGVSVSIFVFGFGIDLHGWIMRTRFPLSLDTNYTKQPVITTKQLDVELVPLELKLIAWVEIKIQIRIGFGWFKVTITIFHKKWENIIWHWTSSALRGTVWKKISRKDDQGPPRFPYCKEVDQECVASGRRRRSVGTEPAVCMVTQLLGRHPKDSAFHLDFTVDDDDSDLDLSYAVGDYPGGTNVQSWTSIRGSVLFVPGGLPCGKPLHFLVRAVNTQRLSTVAQCSLPTFDCTFPDGRVDLASKCTSHRGKLSGRVVVFDDSELEADKLFSAVGYGPGIHGHEVADWAPLTLANTQYQFGVSGNLRHFSLPRLGRLAASPIRAFQAESAATCGGECLKLVTCVSFSFNQFLYACELQSLTEGVFAKRLEDGHYYTYERLGNGYSAEIEHRSLALRHGVRYYINSAVEDVLGYQSVLMSPGIMVDHSPPEPGPVGEGAVEEMLFSGCSASVIQRCLEPVALADHRKIIDGKGAKTVFNGNRRGQDLVFTFENHHAAANWDGFNDWECGIHGYAWAVGTSVCGSDISNFTDPHVTHPHPQDWTHLGLAKHLHLAEGPYFVTVQAVNDIVLGGDLVTTVCHSSPFIVDITPPIMHSVSDVIFDDGFRFLAVYYNATDNLSGIGRLEFGLGKTKYDVMIRKYMPFEIQGNEDNTHLLNKEFETASGVPAWIRLKVGDNVGLSATGHGGTPVLLDSTAPVTGDLMDGQKLGLDSCCQNDNTSICVQWRHFEDPESHIESYWWGVGLSPGQDNVVAFHKLSSNDRHSCASGLSLEHNVTYFSTLVAYNKALNQKAVNASTNGVLIDMTPPLPGLVADGGNLTQDLDFTSETASLTASWGGFRDPETQVAFYSLSVFVNGHPERNITRLNGEQFTDHSFSLVHGDAVQVEVTATNRASGSVAVTSDGLLVDHTPPDLISLGTAAGTPFQQSDASLHFLWEFRDTESGLAEYRYVVHQLLHRRKTKFWPTGSEDHRSVKLSPPSSNSSQSLDLLGLSLTNGATYTLTVTALNRASMAAVEESSGVTVDTTPPVVQQVLLTLLGDEEEVNEHGEVEHIEGESIHVSWKAHDFESGLSHVRLCIDVLGVNCLTSNSMLSLEASSLRAFTTVLSDGGLQVSTDANKVVYQVSLLVINGAGVESAVAVSKPLVVLRGNVAGVVLDGRSGRDEDFTNDKAAVAVTFFNFSSPACGIEGYDWGVGSTPYATDILPYSDFGLVMDLDVAGSGRAQAHVTLTEGKTYYVAVRARTGHACHEPYIVSSSDGITIDTLPPTVTFYGSLGGSAASSAASSPFLQPLTSRGVVMQTAEDRLDLGWEVGDDSGVNRTTLSFDTWGPNPQTLDVAPTSMVPFAFHPPASPGDSLFSSLRAADNAGNEVRKLAPTVMVDVTPPTFDSLQCTKVVSAISPLVTCSWESVSERHSSLRAIEFGVGSRPSFPDLVNVTSVPLHKHRWTFDTASVVNSDLAAPSGFYVIARAVNAAGLQAESSVTVRIDVTPPAVSEVIIVTSPASVSPRERRVCQTPQDFLEIQLTGLAEDESSVESVEIALGTSTGTSDIHPFRPYTLVSGVYARGGLGLQTGSTVFATARVTNSVGLYRLVSSEGVVISPRPRLEVLDGPAAADMDGQTDLNLIQGHWLLTDPCPVVNAEWWVTELGSGRLVRNLSAIPDSGQAFFDDTLSLDNLKTYVTHVRVVDAANRTFEAYSDGTTVCLDTPDTAAVWEGSGRHDMDYQESLQEIVASWEDFGDPRSALPSDRVVRYEVAVGTDRQWSDTRSNIHGFEAVGLVNSYTFHGLNLAAKTVVYYVTVRAYTAANIFSESSSDGIRAGYSGEINAGRALVDSHQSDVHTIRVAWDGFLSDMGELRYYVGVSTSRPPWDNSTRNCEAMLSFDYQYDVSSLQAVQAQSIVILQGLSLDHKGQYYVTVIAEDLMLHCSAAVGGPILVDTTPPVKGRITAQGYDSDTAIFLHSSQTLVVDLGAFPDQESGVETATVWLFQSESCGVPSSQDVLVRAVTAQEQRQITMRDLALQKNVTYFLKIVVRNMAGLETQATSKPLLLSLSPPTPGAVKLGTNWTGGEQLFTGQTDTVEGMIALSSLDAGTSCVSQVDLMSAENRGSWKAATENFSADCSFVEASELSVVVQHSTHLTGVDRGALQFPNRTWAEGNYTVRMRAAAGKNILTGISLTSPSLRPPFLAQNAIISLNQSANACDPVFGTCQTNDSGHGQLLPEEEYGFGVSLAEVNGTSKALFWAQDKIALKQTWVSLGVEPSDAFVDYIFGLKLLAEGAWEVTLSVNGVVKAAVSGLTFPGSMVLSIYTWNVDDYFPPYTDPLKPFRAVSRVTTVRMPLSPPPLCAYGSPFHDGSSGIREVWVGLSSGFNRTADVAPFRLLRSFCTPCLLGCQNICPAACPNGSLPSGFHILPLTLTSLSLQAASEAVNLTTSAASANASSNESVASNTSASEALNAFQLPTYYLDVKVVSQGGLVARAKSSALTVDLSPPSVKEVFCIDPSYADDEPVDYVGSNNSVGLKWDVSEDVSPVASQRVCIGTQSALDDVVPWVEVDRLATEHMFSELNHTLSEGVSYCLSLQVINAAGLSTIASVPFIVSTAPPDMSVISPTPGGVTQVMNVSGVTVAFTNSTDNITLNFNFRSTVDSSNNTLSLIEWSIGTQPGRDDIFPKSVVANRNVTKVAIISGYVELEGDSTNITMQDFAASNFQPSNSSDVSGTKFSMEPGRCLRQSVTGVSRSHTEAVLSSIQPLCIRRSTDQLVLAGNSTLYVGVNRTTSAGSGGSTPDDIKIQTSVSRGGMLVDTLRADDLNAVYGTAASSEFSPYVVLPDPLDSTSRVLKKRLLSTPGPHFYMSPVADMNFDADVDVVYNISTSVLVPPGSVAIILFWDAESKEWKTPRELCPSSVQSYNSETRQIHSQVCLDMFMDASATSSSNTSAAGGSRRSKRSATTTSLTLTPRMFTVAVVGATPVNNPPVIQNITLVLLEDDLNSGVTITYTDDEDDVMSFLVLQKPSHGTVSVTADGRVTYLPAGNYSGGDLIVLQGVEVLDAASTAAGMVPNVVNVSLAVSVLPVNDPPDVFYLAGSNDSNVWPALLVGPAAGNGINVSVLVEGNTTTFIDLGFLVFGDVDINDTLFYIDQPLGDANATFELTDVGLLDPRLSELGMAGSGFQGAGARALSVRLEEGYHGTVSYNARVQDSAGAYSLQLSLTVHVMISPCIHGDCRATALGQTCLDQQRAATFDPFWCHCDPGYEGEWCEKDTDECQLATCSPITDCVDLVNGYRCDPNPEKTAAIVICSILAVILIVVAVFKLKKKNTKIGFEENILGSEADIEVSKPPTQHRENILVSEADVIVSKPPTQHRENILVSEADVEVSKPPTQHRENILVSEADVEVSKPPTQHRENILVSEADVEVSKPPTQHRENILVSEADVEVSKPPTQHSSNNSGVPDTSARPPTAMSMSDLIFDEAPPSSRSDSWDSSLMKLFPYQPVPNPDQKPSTWRTLHTTSVSVAEALRTAGPSSRDSARQGGPARQGRPARQGGPTRRGGPSPASANARRRGDEVATMRPLRKAPGKSPPGASASSLFTSSGRNSMEMLPVDAERETAPTLRPPKSQAQSSRSWLYPGCEQEVFSTSPSAGNRGNDTMETTISTQAEVYAPGPSGRVQDHVMVRSDGAVEDRLRVESWEGEAVQVEDNKRADRARPPSAVSHMPSEFRGFENITSVGE